jgi:transcription-repair coupling factor (superfamily II helicase)
MVSRFRTPREQKVVIEAVRSGKVDVLIGTHRLLSKDVTFRDLGLLVVDEEQRFGVAHKESIKAIRKNLDVLTLTATPIPRTLQMSLAGIRDMSIIETPPESRLAIQTAVVPFREGIIATAIRNELKRDGQVYFVHNRVQSIGSMANLLRRVVPEARIGVAHGQTSCRESSTFCWRPPSSKTASTSRGSIRSSSTVPIASAWRSSTSCAGGSGGPIGAPMPTCWCRCARG